MRWIDFSGKKPTDTDIPGWTPWTDDTWKDWLTTSEEYLEQVKRLHDAGDIKERNKYIDSKSAHWGKLKPWLFALSHQKCWFTEGKDICSYMDVEHFRPKKRVKNVGGDKEDGYWWLSFDYTNFRGAGHVPNRKKDNWFPLHKDSRRSTYADRCEESEIPYLLDPVKLTDTGLLAYNEEGNSIPTPGTDSWEELRAEKTIEWLGLNAHDALPEARRAVWQEVSRAIEKYLAAKKYYKPGINDVPLQIMEDKLTEIRKKTREDAELSSVALWCVRFRNDDQLLRLVQS